MFTSFAKFSRGFGIFLQTKLCVNTKYEGF
jgi:hypothetical protein